MIPGYARLQHERIARSPVTIFVAGPMHLDYPYKLVKPSYSGSVDLDAYPCTILDSGIGDDVTNEEQLALAEALHPTFVMAKDYLGDPAGTAASCNEFAALYADSDVSATPMYPLQPPFIETYERLEFTPYYIALGGISSSATDTTAAQVREYILRLKRHVNNKHHIHVLGVGASLDFVQFVTQHDGIIDSLDCSTPELAAINGTSYGIDLRQTTTSHYTGLGSTASRTGLATHLSYVLNDSFAACARDNPQTDLLSYGV
jgi:hypothetical protein